MQSLKNQNHEGAPEGAEHGAQCIEVTSSVLGPNEPSQAADAYKPTDDEIEAIRRWSAKKNETKTPRIAVERTGENSYSLSFDHEASGLAEVLLSNAIGCPDPDFRYGLLSNLMAASVGNGGQVDERLFNMGIAIVKDIKPTDAVEAMLATQMFAIHAATMLYTQRTLENRLVEDRAEPCLNRLARTFTTQVEALKRYRSKGEQVVRVERVYVGPGGQAVVGNINRAPGGPPSRNREQIHEIETHAPTLPPPDGAAVPIDIAQDKAAMRKRGGARQNQMPLSRRQKRRTERKSECVQDRSL